MVEISNDFWVVIDKADEIWYIVLTALCVVPLTKSMLADDKKKLVGVVEFSYTALNLASFTLASKLI